ncbi:MAG: hypothetical protein ACRDT0_16500 [Pseudonocardiaceae bacterium]
MRSPVPGSSIGPFQGPRGGGRAAGKWRAFAYQELREPGAYFRVLATAAEVQRTGRASVGSASGAGMRVRIEARLADAGRHAVAELIVARRRRASRAFCAAAVPSP